MNEIADAELPEGWIAVPFNDVGKARMGPTILAKDLHETGLAVYSAGQANKPWGYTQRQVPEFQQGTVVVSARGSIGFPKIPSEEVFTSTQTTIAINPTAVTSSRYLQRFLQTVDWADLSSGAAIPMLTISMLGELVVPLAPLAEQKRIADKLEAVLGRVDACRARLDRVPDLLKRFRQSVLAAATSGHLTEDWRAIGIEADLDLFHFDTDGLSIELPKSWSVERADSVCSSVRDGTHDTPKYVNDGIPLITSKNIRPNGIDFDGAQLISTADHQEISKRSKVDKGDILFSMIGSVGHVCLVNADRDFSIKNVGLFKSNRPKIEPKFMFYWLQSPLFTGWLSPKLRGGNQKFASLGLLRESPVILPPLAEQAEIVRRVETLFALADRIEARLATAQRLVERLTPATLSKAFRGDLVPQDPNDEPASTLLNRVSAAASTQPNSKKPKSKS